MRYKYEINKGMYKSLHPFYVNSSYTSYFANNIIETYILTQKLQWIKYHLLEILLYE